MLKTACREPGLQIPVSAVSASERKKQQLCGICNPAAAPQKSAAGNQGFGIANPEERGAGRRAAKKATYMNLTDYLNRIRYTSELKPNLAVL